MFDDVLVPVDGSDCASLAVEYAGDLATRYDATVHVVSVADAQILNNADHADEVRAELSSLVEDVRANLDRRNLVTVGDVLTDVPHDAILRYAEETGVDLVVMGTHGRTGVERYLLGSVTEKVLRLSPTPVLTVSETDDGAVHYPYDSMLVPTDGSEGAMAAVGPALDLAERYDAALHALSVVDETPLGVDVRSEVAADAFGEHAQTAVASIAERAAPRDVQTAVERGRPDEAIREYVESQGIDLVVMGSHGRTGVERYLLGSVAEKLVRTAPVPVLTIPRATDE